MGLKEFFLGSDRGEYKNPYAAQEQQIGNLLWQQSQGLGTSPAQLQMQMGLEAAQRQAASSVAGARGMSPGLAMRMGLGQQAALAGQVNQQAGVLRAQEQARAQQMYAQYLQGLHGLDVQAWANQPTSPGFFENLAGAGMQAGAAYLGSGLGANAAGDGGASSVPGGPGSANWSNKFGQN